jgi:hypothetical protein
MSDNPRAVMKLMRRPAGHGIAVTSLIRSATSLSGNQYLATELHLHCECGWSHRFGEVSTVDYLAELAAVHRAGQVSWSVGERVVTTLCVAAIIAGLICLWWTVLTG